MILYKCNKSKCNECSSKIRNTGLCDHTSDIDFAEHFIKMPSGEYWEKEPEPIYLPIENEIDVLTTITLMGISGFLGIMVGGLLF